MNGTRCSVFVGRLPVIQYNTKINHQKERVESRVFDSNEGNDGEEGRA